MWKSLDILCEACGSLHIQLENVPYGEPLPNVVTCEKCGDTNAKRLISATVHKAHVENDLHGTRLSDGRVVSRSTLGARSAAEQSRLNKLLKQAKKAGQVDLARDVNTELQAKKEEVKKKL